MKTDRDAALDRLLRDRSLAAIPTRADCLDAETLAAWVDGTLTRAERTAAEAHVSDCARCQAALAAMAKMNPPPAVHSWWSLPSVWLLPLSAAAAAAIVWAVVPSRRPVAPSASATVAEQTPAKAPERAARRDPESELKRQDSAVAASPAPSGSQRAKVPAAPRPALVEPRREAQKSALEKIESAPAVPPPAAAETVSRGAEPAAKAMAAAAAPQPAPPEQSRQRAADQIVSARTFALTERRSAEIVSPDPSSRWRIVAGGAVQHSSDGGVTWETQLTGVNVTFAAGSAPSAEVCWLVGPGGVVVRSIDGRTWLRAAFPESIALQSVRATDEQNATVTASDGRIFFTSDGGKTWK